LVYASSTSALATSGNLTWDGQHFVDAVGNIVSGFMLVARGGGVGAEGGQLVLGYGNNAATGIVSQGNSTWNIDVDSLNSLRLFRQGSTGAVVNVLSVAESTGVVTFNNSTVFSSLTASKPVFTDASKNLVSTGTLASDQGGTGLTSYTAGDLLYYSSGTLLSKLGIGAANRVLTSSGSAPQWSDGLTLSTLSVSSTVSGTGFSNYLASPPAIGGTAAAAGSFTTLTASTSVTSSSGQFLNGGKTVTLSALNTWTNLGIATVSGLFVYRDGSLGGMALYITDSAAGAVALYNNIAGFQMRFSGTEMQVQITSGATPRLVRWVVLSTNTS